MRHCILAAALFFGWLPAALAGALTISTPESLPLLSRDEIYQANLSSLIKQNAAYAAAADDDAAGIDVEVRKLLAKGEGYVAGKYGPNSRSMAAYLTETFHYLWLLGDLDGFIERGRRAVALERYAVSNAVFFDGYIPYQAGFMDMESVGEFLDAAFEFAAVSDENGKADRAVPMRAAAFEIAQAAFIGNGARLAVRKLRRAPTILEPQKSANAMVIAATENIHAFAAFQNSVSNGLYGERGTQKRAQADAQIAGQDRLIRAATSTIIQYNTDVSAIIMPAMLPVPLVQDQLNNDEALLVLVPGATWFHVFVVTQSSFTWNRTEASWIDIQDRINILRAEMGVSSPRSASAIAPATGGNATVIDASVWLFKNLLGSSAPAFKGKPRLLVAAAGFASTFPLSILAQSRPADTVDFARVEWLIRDHAIQTIPSVEMLSDRDRKTASARPSYLGIANPDYQGDVTDRFGTTVSRMIAALPPLPESQSEIEHILPAMDPAASTSLSGDLANESVVEELSAKGILSQFEIIHFATHGLISGPSSDYTPTGLALTPQIVLMQERPVSAAAFFHLVPDGLLTLAEISRLRIAARLVILSACDTAGHEAIDDSGFGGLAASFIDAGARNVVASHWPVMSQAAVELISDMTVRLVSQQPDEALRQASLVMIAQGGAKAHPRYWGPFSVYGSP